MTATSSLQKCNGCRTAVVMRIGDAERTVMGHANWEQDEELGSVLRIVIEDVQGVHELLIAESHWDGQITDGAEYDCDFCIVPQAAPFN